MLHIFEAYTPVAISKFPLKRSLMPFVTATLLGITLCANAQDSTTFKEQYKLIKAPTAVAKIGIDLFGDDVNLYNGGLSFKQTDVSLPGNSALPVSIGRQLTAGASSSGKRAFGKWDLDIPRMHGTFALGNSSKRQGWTDSGGGKKRCTSFGPPAEADGLNFQSLWSAEEFWHGNFMYVPGAGSQQLLNRAADHTNKPGTVSVAGYPPVTSFPVVTANNWAIGCLPFLANDTTAGKTMGEGFVAVSPDGTRYIFNWMIAHLAPTLSKSDAAPQGFAKTTEPTDLQAQTEQIQIQEPHVSNNGKNKDKDKGGGVVTPQIVSNPRLPLSEVWILPTRVIDRFGNWVEYTYDVSRPANLTRISSSDGRVITITYVADAAGPTNLIKSVFDGTRTWNYSYHGSGITSNLDKVTLPDNSTWDFSATDTLLVDQYYVQGEPSVCAERKQPYINVLQGTMVHPSGAQGVFTLTPTEHGRSDVQYFCMGKTISTPVYFYTNTLTKKAITGPGLAPMEWNYSYGPANGSFSPCNGCITTRTVSVSDPKGDVTRYTFGNRYYVDEGRLKQTDIGWNGSAALRSTVVGHRAPGAGPYPMAYGESWVQNGQSHRIEPKDSEIITQQGVEFKWLATGFDNFGRTTAVTRSSTVSGSRSETTLMSDNLPLWVLGQVKTVTVNAKVQVENEYSDITANLMRVSRSGKLDHTNTYHTEGTLNTVSDALNQTTTYTNYRRGIAQNVSYADATTASAVVNNLGKIDSITNEVNVTTAFQYDTMGRLKAVIHPNETGQVSNPTTIDLAKIYSDELGIPAGHWRQDVTTGRGRTTSYFDAFFRPLYTQSVDLDNVAGTASFVKYAYDFQGNTTFQAYPKRTAAELTEGVYTDFDALGRNTQSRADSELGQLTTTTTYLSGFVKRATDARGNATETRYQAFDQPSDTAIVSVDAPRNMRVVIDRDIFGKTKSITRSGALKSATRSYVYDAFDRLCKTIEPETGATVQVYDLANNVKWRATGLALPGTTTCDDSYVAETSKMAFGYDRLNRLTSTTFGDGSPAISRTYTPDGQPGTITSNGAVWTNAYYNRGLHKQETLAYGGVNYTLSREYDANGSLTKLVYPANSITLDYMPNALGQPRKVGAYATGITYHPSGAIAGFTYGNNIVHTMTPNKRGLPQQARDVGVINDVYSYDQNANVLGIADTQQGVASRTMTYDELDRLWTADAPALWGNAVYAYDELDNLTSATISAGANARTTNHAFHPVTNRLTGITSSNAAYNLDYEYDNQGNIIKRGAQTYAFDQGNRMKSAAGRATYAYDGLGHRVSVIGNDGLNRVQVYSQAEQLMYAGPAAAPVKYVYLKNHVLAEVSTSGVSYSHTDGLGSPVARTNSAGALVSQTRYEPYGQVATGPVQTIGFTGHVNDIETGLTYMQQRYYDPVAGRFLSIDPVVTDANTGGSFNRYAYANNSPYKYIDPDGRKFKLAGDSKLDKAEFKEIKNWLKKNGSGIIKAIDNDKKNIVHVVMERGTGVAPNFNPETNTITFDPHVGNETTTGGRQSPALIFEHEADHAKQDIADPASMKLGGSGHNFDAQYGKAEERRVIEGSEKATATKSGSNAVRDNHKGTLVPVKCATCIY